MKVFLIAAVAIAVSGAAFAKDFKGGVMTDAEMERVTAGAGLGLDTAIGASNGKASIGFENGILSNPISQPPGGLPGLGKCTANRPGASCG